MLQNENAGNKSYRILADRSRMTKQQWEDLRQNYIGGSDAAAVIGISRFRSPLSVYLEKKSLVKKEPQNERMLWGVRIEPLLRDRFQELTGYEVRELKYVLQSVENSFAIANLDGIVNLGPAEGNQWACLELNVSMNLLETLMISEAEPRDTSALNIMHKYSIIYMLQV